MVGSARTQQEWGAAQWRLLSGSCYLSHVSAAASINVSFRSCPTFAETPVALGNARFRGTGMAKRVWPCLLAPGGPPNVQRRTMAGNSFRRPHCGGAGRVLRLPRLSPARRQGVGPTGVWPDNEKPRADQGHGVIRRKVTPASKGRVDNASRRRAVPEARSDRRECRRSGRLTPRRQPWLTSRFHFSSLVAIGLAFRMWPSPST